ncbi:response regulator receiver domain [Azospirillum sp. sgz301742]
MQQLSAYQSAVLDSFHGKALKSVLLIDDQFPTYKDVLRNDRARFTEEPKALRLYEAFHRRRMICDVENDVANLDLEIERFKKSDLIVLDYHLIPGSDDGVKAVDVVLRLSASAHFNTIIIYTRHRNLAEVWLELAGRLRQGWAEDESGIFDKDGEKAEELTTQWDLLSDRLPDPPISLIRSYVTHGQKGWTEHADAEAFRKELEAEGVPKWAISQFIEALIHRFVRNTLKKDYAGSKREVAGAYKPDYGICWVQAGNCFVAVARKADGVTADENDPDGLFATLDAALLDWKPSLIQVIGSEIQNLLELQALATDELNLKDPLIRTGLSYFMLEGLGSKMPPDEDRVWASVETIIDKLVDTLRRRIGDDEALRTMATSVFREKLQEIGWAEPSTPNGTWDAAIQLGAPQVKPVKDKVGFALNYYLSNEPRPRRHVTTGTVFQKVGTDEFWICASPSCDMVARSPHEDQVWLHSLFPTMPMLALRLHSMGKVGDALKNATQGRHVFVRAGEQEKAFCIESSSVKQVIWEFFFLPGSTTLTVAAGRTSTFSASRVRLNGDRQPALDTENFAVVGQLRPQNASRFLQMAGQHLSRIGMDHVKLGG